MRRFLSTLLAALLLLPQTLCVCHAGAGPWVDGQHENHDHAPADLAPDGPGQPDSDHPAHGPAQPHDHAPGCPAVNPEAGLMKAEQAITLFPLLGALPSIPERSASVLLLSPAAHPPLDRDSLDVPLFLLLLTLRI